MLPPPSVPDTSPSNRRVAFATSRPSDLKTHPDRFERVPSMAAANQNASIGGVLNSHAERRLPTNFPLA